MQNNLSPKLEQLLGCCTSIQTPLKSCSAFPGLPVLPVQAVPPATSGMLPAGRQAGEGREAGAMAPTVLAWCHEGFPFSGAILHCSFWAAQHCLVEMLGDEDLTANRIKINREGKILIVLTSSFSPKIHREKANQNKGTNCRWQQWSFSPYQTSTWFWILIHPFKAFLWISEMR